jgi:hypothetical protein
MIWLIMAGLTAVAGYAFGAYCYLGVLPDCVWIR